MISHVQVVECCSACKGKDGGAGCDTCKGSPFKMKGISVEELTVMIDVLNASASMHRAALHEVRAVRMTYQEQQANALLKAGWILLHVSSNLGFALGWKGEGEPPQ